MNAYYITQCIFYALDRETIGFYVLLFVRNLSFLYNMKDYVGNKGEVINGWKRKA